MDRQFGPLFGAVIFYLVGNESDGVSCFIYMLGMGSVKKDVDVLTDYIKYKLKYL